MFAPYRRQRRDTRTRKDRINQRNEGFERQMPGMVDEYMFWKEKLGEKGMSEMPTSSSSEGIEGTMHLHIIDVFCEFLKVFYFLVSDPRYQRHIHLKSSSAPLIRGFPLPSCVMASYPALLSPQA
jgi:hypothetical protein